MCIAYQTYPPLGQLVCQGCSTHHNILKLVLGQPFGYSRKHCNKLLKKDFIPFLCSYAHSSTTFFHFSDTCSLGSNGSTKFLKSLLSLIPF
jgi:hypothetical protein